MTLYVLIEISLEEIDSSCPEEEGITFERWLHIGPNCSQCREIPLQKELLLHIKVTSLYTISWSELHVSSIYHYIKQSYNPITIVYYAYAVE